VPEPVDAGTYDSEYFLCDCEGHEEFSETGGSRPSNRLAAALSDADIARGMRVLDVGCGRGESLIWSMRRGAEAWGVDYAQAALRIARRSVCCADECPAGRVGLVGANARCLPFGDGTFDRVLMLDIVEHLHPWELAVALREVTRVLRRGGRLVVHTAPNLWYYRFGYPVLRFVELFRGVRLPRNPRDRFRYHRHVHVNEQSPRSLAAELKRAGLAPRIWVDDLQRRWAGRGILFRMLGWIATHMYPLKWVFCGDVLGQALKE
jgi:cyclopropane fatty-acyl-phospholipid synthase-like methyltransferase